MIPNYLVIRGDAFTDLTSPAMRSIFVEAYFESRYEAEEYAKKLAETRTRPETYYIIRFEKAFVTTMVPTVSTKYALSDVPVDPSVPDEDEML